MCQSLFLIKLQACLTEVCNFIKKKKTQEQVSSHSCEFFEMSKNKISYRRPLVAAFVLYFSSISSVVSQSVHIKLYL